jgi:hypothetical protein
MKKITLLFVAIVFSVNGFSQPGIQWQKCFGGTKSDGARSIQPTTDDGYIMCGFTDSDDFDVSGNHSPDTSDAWLVKLDGNGTIQWQKCFGGTLSEWGNYAVQTNDGGFIMAGVTLSADGDVSGNHSIFYRDYWIVKTDSAGNMQWQKCLGGTADDEAYHIQQTTDGGYIVSGYTDSHDGDVTGGHGFIDYWLVKLDSSGNIDWQKSYGGSSEDWGRSVKQTSDGGYIMTGYALSGDGDITAHYGLPTTDDVWIVKTDSLGNIQWQKNYGGSHSDGAFSIIQTADGGYIAAGRTMSNDSTVAGNHSLPPYYDGWIVKLDSAGNLQWQKCLGGTDNDNIASIIQTPDGGYFVGGNTFSTDGDVSGNHGTGDYWAVKLDSNSNIQWQRCLGGTGWENASSVVMAQDGGFVVAGFASTNDGDITGNHGMEDCWVVKFESTVGINEAGIAGNSISVYPNPTTNEHTIIKHQSTIINVEIFNPLGEKVYNNAKGFWSNVETINVSKLSSGIYFVRVRTSDRMMAGKFVKE